MGRSGEKREGEESGPAGPLGTAERRGGSGVGPAGKKGQQAGSEREEKKSFFFKFIFQNPFSNEV